MKCYIIRGLPGSSKSTYAGKLREGKFAKGFEIDLFFMKNGEYVFDPSKLGEYHTALYKSFCTTIIGARYNCITVANTNLSVWEYAPYYCHAAAYGYEVEIHTLECNLDICLARQTHNVSVHTMVRMQENLAKGSADMPIWWKHHCVNTEK